MANKTIDALVFYPFYMSEAPLSITCEGIVGEATVSKFPTKKKKEEHEQNFCTGHWCKGCGVYAALMQNYVPNTPAKRSPRAAVTMLRH